MVRLGQHPSVLSGLRVNPNAAPLGAGREDRRGTQTVPAASRWGGYPCHEPPDFAGYCLGRQLTLVLQQLDPPHDTASAPALSADEGVIVHKVVCGHLVKERGLPLKAGALRRLQQPKICGSRLQVHNLITCWSQAVAEITVSVGIGVRADTNLDRTELEQEPITGTY